MLRPVGGTGSGREAGNREQQSAQLVREGDTHGPWPPTHLALPRDHHGVYCLGRLRKAMSDIGSATPTRLPTPCSPMHRTRSVPQSRSALAQARRPGREPAIASTLPLRTGSLIEAVVVGDDGSVRGCVGSCGVGLGGPCGGDGPVRYTELVVTPRIPGRFVRCRRLR